MPRFVAIVALLLAACTSPAPERPSAQSEAETTVAAEGRAASAPASADPGPTVWVANEAGRSLTRVDVTTGASLDTRDMPGRPHNVTVSPAGVVAATLPAEGSLFLLTPSGEGRVVPLGGQPHDVKAAGSRFVVANEGNGHLQFVGEDGRPADEIALPYAPHDLAVSADGRTAWVSLDGSDGLAEVDLPTATLRRIMPTGASPHDLLLGPRGDLWVTDWQGPARVYSDQGEFKGVVELGRESHHLAFSGDGEQVWVTDNAAGRVFVVDTLRLVVLDSIGIAGAPHHVAVVGDRVAVADGVGGLVIFDRLTRRQLLTTPTGAEPHGVAAVR